MNFVFLVILALSALRSGDADGCTSPYDEGPYTVEILHLSVPINKIREICFDSRADGGGKVPCCAVSTWF
jgi:hypothetical protein